MRRAARLLYRALAALGTLLLLGWQLRLYLPAAAAYGAAAEPPDAEAQLRFIRASLGGGSGEEMQRLFPEGFFFTHVTYGLAWVELGLRRPPGSPARAEAIAEARWALARLDTPAATAPFAPDLDPPRGVFYVGWSSWLRGGVLMLQPAGARGQAEQDRFARDCEALALAFGRRESPFLPAYLGQSWPVDSVVAVAALALHDRLLPPRFAGTVAAWRAAALERLDPATGLLPHRVDPRDGSLLEGARGSSQSIINRFLPEIDPGWGRGHYARFRALFVDAPFGLPGVREFPPGVASGGDVDSGPLVAGLSASATVVTLGAALRHGDRALAEPLVNAIEFVGLPLELGGGKRYMLGLLPVGDAFLVWSKTAQPWLDQPAPAALPAPVAWWWRLPWHGLAAALLALVWLPALRSLRPRRLRQSGGSV
jgi:hypothetical protein